MRCSMPAPLYAASATVHYPPLVPCGCSVAALLASNRHSVTTMEARVPTNQPLPTLDLTRYLGLWHEIAHLPLFFQRNCVEGVTATYTQNPDGTIGVLNGCCTVSGSRESSMGIARTTKIPGALKVTFVPRWLRWLPRVWADYWVIDIDPNYRWSVVGGPTRKYLWILGREPSMTQATFNGLTAHAASCGYPVARLILTSKLL
jgi:apolipoprotein D and lipocalin family protein